MFMKPAAQEGSTASAPKFARPIVQHLAILALVAALPFAALATYLAIEDVADELAVAKDSMARFAQATANDVDRTIKRTRLIIGDLASRPEVAALEPGHCDRLLSDVLRLHPEYANVFTLDASGRRVCSARPPAAGVPERVDPRNYLDAARQAKAFTVGKPSKGLTSGRWVVSAVEPLFDGHGGFTGVVGASLDLAYLGKLIDENLLANEAVSMIVDSNGTVLARYPDPGSWAGRDMSDLPIFRDARERRFGTARGKGVLGVERIWGFSSVPETNWIVLAGVPTDVALAPAYQTAGWVAGLGLVSALLVVLLCITLARPIAGPIGAIAAAARRMASGESDEKIARSGPAEVAALAGDLNRLLERQQADSRALRARESELSLITDNFPGGVAHFDRDLRLQFASPVIGLMFGRDPDEAVGEHMRDIVGEEFYATREEVCRRALAGERQTYESQRPGGDGKLYTFLTTLVPDLDAAGNVQGFFSFSTDITPLREAENLFHQESARLGGIVASAMDAIVMIDAAQRITLFNPAAEKMFGRSAGEVMGHNLDILLPPSLRAGHPSHVARFGSTGVSNRAMGAFGTVYGLRANGQQFPLEASISQIEMDGEKLYTAILRDITSRHLAEATSIRLAAIVESSDDAIIGKELDGTITNWNRGAELLFGYAASEVVGKSILILIPPELREEEAQIIASIKRGEAVRHFETTRVRKDGSLVDVSVSVSPIKDTQGRIVGAAKLARDITERKRAEQALVASEARLRTLFEHAPIGIVIADGEGYYTEANAAMCEMLGYRRGELLGRHSSEFVAPSEVPHIDPALSAIHAREPYHREWQFRRKDGSIFTAEVVAAQMPDGSPMGMIRDITERLRAQEALRELNASLERRVAERTAELEAANRELETFDYSISHDLRAPVNRVRGFSTALLEEFGPRLDPKVADYVKRIQVSANSMERLVDDLLSLATVSRAEVKRSSVDLSTLARDIVETLKTNEPTRDLELIVADDIRAHADPGLMRIVLDNLLGNAWKFTSRRSGARIEFGRDREGGETRYFVRDNGAGFDSESAGKLFEPFRRLHSKSDFPGTGIGLATVQRVISRHGGRVWAEGAVGQGAVIFFTLSA